MTSEALIALSAAVEPWLGGALGSVVVVLAADALLTGRDDRGAPGLDAPIAPWHEGTLLAAIVLGAALVRVVGWDRGLTPALWFPQMSILHVAGMLEQGRVGASWLGTLRLTQVGWAHESAFGLPVEAGLQAILGPRFGLPVLGGAIFGTAAVLIAWALGRTVRSAGFGLTFAALVAFSPLGLAWSRIGTYYIGAVPHVLLALWVGWLAGWRGSFVLGLVAGAVAWASLYHYYVARVAIPLVAAAILAGGERAGRRQRGLVLVVIAAVTFAALAYAAHGAGFTGRLWPSYPAYPGNKGERDLADFVAQNLASFQAQAWRTVDSYFFRFRSRALGDVWTPGMGTGGLVLLPTALLGALGFLVICRRWRAQGIWLAVGAAGFLLPVLSMMTARRTLVLDVAWSAFAAQGLLALVDWLGRGVGRPARAVAAIVTVAGIAVAGTVTVFVLGAELPASGQQHIPFGDSGFGDGLACKRCIAAARGWSRDIADGAFVVLFDNDAELEGRTSPGGLAAYGKIATLVARRPGLFVEAYALMANWDVEPTRPGVMYDRSQTNFVRELADRIRQTAPERIVWHFERPSAWERWLAGRLVEAGGTEERFQTALSSTPGIRVVTPWEGRAAALAVVREIGMGLEPGDETRCVTLVAGRAPTLDRLGSVFLLGTRDDGLRAPPEWFAGSWWDHRYKTFALASQTSAPVGVRIDPEGEGQTTIETLGRYGEPTRYELPSLRRETLASATRRHLGLNCALWLDGHWWMLDPASGRIESSHPGVAGAPSGPWIGLGASAAGELVLAGADQTMVRYDPKSRREVARFSARVAPSVRDTTDECSPIAVGAGWIATTNLRTGVLSFYGHDGHDFGTYRLGEVMPLPPTLTTIGGAGRYLGVASSASVVTFELTIDSACGEGARTSPRSPRPE